jgi:MFS family permease
VLITAWVQIVALSALSIPLHWPDQSWAQPVAITLAISVFAIGSIGGPAWFAWTADLIPPSLRGRYSSGRMRLHHAARLGFAIAFAQIMEHWTAASGATGLQLLLVLAALSRFGSWWLVRGMPNEGRRRPPEPFASETSTGRLAAKEARDFRGFLGSLTRTSLGRWTLVWAALHAGTMLAGPFFQVYWLTPLAKGGLGMAEHPTQYTMLVYISTVVRLLFFPIAGRLVDRYRPAPLLRVAVVGIALVPLGHALSTNLPVLLITEVLSGLSWGLAECSVGVLVLTCSSDPGHRARLIGYRQTVVCTVIAGFTVLGGQLLTLLPTLDGSVYRMLFLVSLFARLPAVLLAMRFLPALADDQQLTGIWRLIPGLQPTVTLSKGVIRAYRGA